MVRKIVFFILMFSYFIRESVEMGHARGEGPFRFAKPVSLEKSHAIRPLRSPGPQSDEDCKQTTTCFFQAGSVMK